ncbi:MAG: GNAT family N-acetyltransferase [Pseudolysinimonas sp.]|uniref:GNAT family N-acetyltransferase n=1 Tax=Pseudolysinimonas sp. TaxID=2680009 RepID=UPI00326422B1
MTIDVRPLAATDEESWRRLFRDYGVFYETDFEDDVLERVWTLLMTPGAGVAALTAEHDGDVVGFAHYRSHPDTFSAGRDWFLDDLYVDPTARGKGAATALIEHLTALAKATGPGTLRWITAETNERAQRVYDRVATRTTWVTYEVRL